jgi:hypothetical protein
MLAHAVELREIADRRHATRELGRGLGGQLDVAHVRRHLLRR